MQIKRSDTLVVGALAGIIAKLVQDVLGYIYIYFLPEYRNCVRIAAGLLLTENQVMQGGFWPYLLGIQIDTIVGIVVSILSLMTLDKWGYDHYILKGAMVGLISWAFFYAFLSRYISSVSPEPSILFIQLSFIKHIAYGIAITTSALWLRKRFDGKHI